MSSCQYIANLSQHKYILVFDLEYYTFKCTNYDKINGKFEHNEINNVLTVHWNKTNTIRYETVDFGKTYGNIFQCCDDRTIPKIANIHLSFTIKIYNSIDTLIFNRETNTYLIKKLNKRGNLNIISDKLIIFFYNDHSHVLESTDGIHFNSSHISLKGTTNIKFNNFICCVELNKSVYDKVLFIKWNNSIKTIDDIADTDLLIFQKPNDSIECRKYLIDALKKCGDVIVLETNEKIDNYINIILKNKNIKYNLLQNIQ